MGDSEPSVPAVPTAPLEGSEAWIAMKKLLPLAYAFPQVTQDLLLEEDPLCLLRETHFADDEAYVAFITFQVSLWTSNKYLFNNLKLGPEKSIELMHTLRQAIAAVDALKQRRLAVCPADCLQPRFVRIFKRLGLSEAYQRALEFAFVSQVSVGAITGLETNTVEVLMDYSRITPRQFLGMTQPTSDLVQLGFLEIETEYKNSLAASTVRSSVPALRIMAGSRLSQAEFLQVDNTVLAEILAEEPDFNLGLGDSLGESAEAFVTQRAGGDAGLEGTASSFFEMLEEQTKARAVMEAMAEQSEKEEAEGEEEEEADAEAKLLPYTDDIDYLNDHFELVSAIIRAKYTEKDEKNAELAQHRRMMDERQGAGLRQELRAVRGKKRMLESRCRRRMALTLAAESGWLPRLELLARNLHLDEFERKTIIIVVGGIISPDVKMVGKRNDLQSFGSMDEQLFHIGALLFILCDDLQEQMDARKYFYRNSKLVREGILHVTEASPWTRAAGDLTSNRVEIDRRMLDFIAGLDTELDEIVEGSNLYAPKVTMDSVVLPKAKKELLVQTVASFDLFKECQKEMSFSGNEGSGSGRGLILLFYGTSGTGKTLTANALAAHMGKRLLLINFGNLGDRTGEKLRFIFRESKINNAVLFFDECEAMFESRDRVRSSDMAAILTEIEKHDGLIILATNRAYDMDEAMYRRINLSVEFDLPNASLRKEIWQAHLPDAGRVAEDVDVDALATSYELSGGFIKNAILAALSSAITREGETYRVRMADFMAGAKLQLEGCMAFMSEKFDRRIIPTTPLSSLVLEEKASASLAAVVAGLRSSKILQQDWGFSDSVDPSGCSCLFHGEPGTGKATAADAIGFEMGKPLLILSAASLLSRHVYQHNGLEKMFKEARKGGAVLCIRDFDRLFDELATGGPNALDMGLLMFHIHQFEKTGVVVLCARDVKKVDKSVVAKMRHCIHFALPSRALRTKLWRKAVPDAVPLASDVSLEQLADKFSFSGGTIQKAAYQACVAAAARPEPIVTMDDFVTAAEEVRRRSNDATRTGSSLYS